MEGDIPLPTHSTEQSPQQSEVQNTTIPREDTSVTTTGPASAIPLEPLLLRLDSLGNVINEEIPRLPERPVTETYMGSTQPIFGEEYGTPVRPSTATSISPTTARSIWRTPSGRNLYEHFESIRHPFRPDDLPGRAGPSGQTMSHPVDQIVRPTIPLQTAQSTIVPHIPTIPAGNPVITQAPIGTPVTPRPNLPFGFRALNASATTTAQTTAQITPGSSIPIQQPGGTVLGGPNPIGNIGQTFTTGPQIPGTPPQTGGHPPAGGKIPFGGHPHAGGQPQTGVHHQPQGQTVSMAPNPWSIPFQGNPHASTGPTVPATSNPWNVPFQGNPHFPAGQNPQTPQQPPYGQMPNPTLNPQNPSGYPPLTQTSHNTSNPLYLGQNQPNMRGPTSYNYPHNPVLGPTGVPLPHQHYPQVNRQLPFLATLDLPDLSRLTNDPIHHSSGWPTIPAKLPSDIPKFDGKSGEDPNNHVMTFHLWCSSNSLMDDSIRLRLFQRTLTGSAAKWYIELPRASFYDFNSLAMSFLTHFQLPIRYETGTELLTSLRQTTSIHISDHIHEWRRRRRLIKAVIPDQLLAEWFTKSLLPQIARDVAMGGVVTEEEAIARAQYLDLVYSQSGTLYELIPNATRPSNDPSKPSNSSHADGVIGSVKTQSTTQSTGTIQRPTSTAAPSSTTPSSTPPTQTQVSDVNVVQSTSSQQPGGKKKARNKTKKNNNNDPPKTQTQTPAAGKRPQQKPKFPCLICGDDHYTRDCPHRDEVAKIFKGNSQPAVLTQPFPQQQSLVAQTPTPGGSSNQPHDETSTSAHIYMFNGVNLTTRSTTYDTPVKPDKSKTANGSSPDPSPPAGNPPSVSPPSGPLQIEKPSFDSILRPPKSTIRKSTFNPNSRAAQNYNIVEDLAQAPCAMSALEVLQHCPTQRKTLLAAIGAFDPESSNYITFNLDDYRPRLSHQLAFQIDVVVHNQQIHRTILDEGASTCVMSLSCWKGLKSPALNKSPTMLRAFDGRGFHPHGLLQSLAVQLGGKTVTIDVEVVDAPLDYNLLLGRSWFYAMTVVASSVFRCVQFPHQGKIVTIDQLDFCTPDARIPATNNIPFLGDHAVTYESVGVGLLKDSSLMGTFPTPLPPTASHIAAVNMISTWPQQSLESSDPWIVPSPLEFDGLSDTMPLSPAEAAYVAIQSTSPSSNTSHSLALDTYSLPSWLNSLSSAVDYISHIFPSDESIMEMLSIDDLPWDDNHHRSSFLPILEDVRDIQSVFPPDVTNASQLPILTQDTFSEGNMGNISPTITIDISVKEGVVENINLGANCTPDEVASYTALFQEFRDVFAWSYEEMPGIDPSIVIHEIKTYPDAKPVRQKLRPVHPKKLAAIKAEVEKLLKSGFIYPVPLTEWVSNLVPVAKKQGTIRVCVDYRDLNKACPKDNYPTPFIDQIIDNCAGSVVFSFMDGFSGYNQIEILPADQHKTAFICPWGTFAYRKLPFGLKNAGATFQRAMSYAFHDIKHIAEPYLDDLPAHSSNRPDHIDHLRAIFLRCRFYRIRLNPHKCIFVVESGRLLGFIVSKDGIRVDPLKIQAILALPPPKNLTQLQSLQGKANFLRRFICNYAEITKGFMRLLQKNVPFIWDDTAQRSFNALKHALTHAPLLHPPDYTKDYLLYLAASTSTIAMVLVQEDSNGEEHVIYYLSKSLSGPELRYSHVEKLAMAAVIAVQRFRHYILLRTTTVIANSNPMYHVLTRQVLGGKYSKWIVILQEFDLEFTKAKAKKSLVFAELICALPSADENNEPRDPLPDESLFLISTSDPWYGDILLYLQTQRFQPNISREERRRIRHHSRRYLILGDTLYRRGIDTILRRCLIHEEAERVLNDCHLGACGGHLSGMATAQKILRAGYFWPSIFKDCIEAVKKCPPCQIFNKKARTHPTALHPIIAIGPFSKWGIDFMQCKPTSAGGHSYIIVAVDYFTKWAEAMPTFLNDGRTAALFLFNHIITRFGVPHAIVTDHGAHFKNQMMSELHVKLGFRHENSSPYYPQANGQVEAINKVLKTMIQRMVGENKTSWHLQLFSALWAYRTSAKTSTGFTPFQLVYGIEAVLPIECEIPSLKLKVELLPHTSAEEERFLYLSKLDETRRDAALINEAHQKRIKSQYDKSVQPRAFAEGDLVLVYDQAHDKLGTGKLEPMWHGPYIVKRVLHKGAYELVDYDGISLGEPRNGLYLKKYYA
jgi:hypothetical protein